MTKLQQRATITTNKTPGSVCTVNVPVVTFATLWAGYPSSPPYVDPKTGKPPPGYSNQCAIKISASVHAAGVEMKSFKGRSKIVLNGKNAAGLAEELAAWLKTQPFCGLPTKPEAVTGADWQTKIKGRTGIVYFADYWKRNTDAKERPTGDHIDLWNGSRLTASGLLGTLTTMARFLGQRSIGAGTDWGYSDLGTSREILFWEVR
jgi:hypothetical protein